MTIKNPTTVAQLIAALQAFPPETRAMVDGYEGGYDDPVSPALIVVDEEPYESDVCGQYTDGTKIPAVLIARPGR